MDLGVRGKAFVIFGGSRGIGLAAAATLVADGADVVLVGRDGDHASSVAGALAGPGTATGVGADLTETGAAERVLAQVHDSLGALAGMAVTTGLGARGQHGLRSEEHTSELQSLMRISYAVFCLKKKKQ